MDLTCGAQQVFPWGDQAVPESDPTESKDKKTNQIVEGRWWKLLHKEANWMSGDTFLPKQAEVQLTWLNFQTNCGRFVNQLQTRVNPKLKSGFRWSEE